MLNSTILNVFGQSPIKPMQKHMDKIHGCVVELKPFFECVYQNKWEESRIIHQRIMSLEEDADNLKKEIRLHLPSSLFLPVSRGDLLGLLTSQDKIASKAKHISGLVLSRQIQFPDPIANAYQSFVGRSIDAASMAQRAIHELDELVETGFRGKEVQIVEQMILDLDQVERDTDQLQVNLRSDLFTIEKKLDPVDVIFMYKLIDWTGELADRAQHVGHRLESILAR